MKSPAFSISYLSPLTVIILSGNWDLAGIVSLAKQLKHNQVKPEKLGPNIPRPVLI